MYMWVMAESRGGRKIPHHHPHLKLAFQVVVSHMVCMLEMEPGSSRETAVTLTPQSHRQPLLTFDTLNFIVFTCKLLHLISSKGCICFSFCSVSFPWHLSQSTRHIVS